MIIKLSNLSEIQNLVRDNKTKHVIIKFTAKWCTSCKAIDPAYMELSDEGRYNDVIFCSYDVSEDNDANIEISNVYKVSGLPTFIIFSDGNYDIPKYKQTTAKFYLVVQYLDSCIESKPVINEEF
jgi:thiol:disulfide interchange protein